MVRFRLSALSDVLSSCLRKPLAVVYFFSFDFTFPSHGDDSHFSIPCSTADR